jgi:hypothetical protein
MKKLIIKIAVTITYLAMVIVNFLANAIPINNRTAGQVSDTYPNLFAPAGITFSIWGVIYLLLGAYTFYQLGFFQKGKIKQGLFEKIGVYFILSSIANFLWIFAWHYDFIGISLLLIILMLYSLIKIATILRNEKFSFKDYLFINLPFSIYFGWITVATIANVTIFLVSINWNGFGLSEQIWTIIILLIGSIIGIWRMMKDKNIAYGLVFVWAYLGIWIKHSSLTGFNSQYPYIIITAVSCIILFLGSIGFLSYYINKS